jgi:hypothetical protein
VHAATAKLEGLRNRCRIQEGGCDIERRSIDAPFLLRGGCSLYVFLTTSQGALATLSTIAVGIDNH